MARFDPIAASSRLEDDTFCHCKDDDEYIGEKYTLFLS